jgi:hypothetical protein
MPKITLTSASKTPHNQFNLIHRHQLRLRGRRCDRLRLSASAGIDLTPWARRFLSSLFAINAELTYIFLYFRVF